MVECGGHFLGSRKLAERRLYLVKQQTNPPPRRSVLANGVNQGTPSNLHHVTRCRRLSILTRASRSYVLSFTTRPPVPPVPRHVPDGPHIRRRGATRA